jgi:hypothetical protein
MGNKYIKKCSACLVIKGNEMPSCSSEWLSSGKQTTINAGEDARGERRLNLSLVGI